MPRITYEEVLADLEQRLNLIEEQHPASANRERCIELYKVISAGIIEAKIRIAQKQWLAAGEEAPMNALKPCTIPKSASRMKRWVDHHIDEINMRHDALSNLHSAAFSTAAAEDSDDEASAEDLAPVTAAGKKAFVASRFSTAEPVSWFSSDSSSPVSTDSYFSDSDEMSTDPAHSELATIAGEALSSMRIASGPATPVAMFKSAPAAAYGSSIVTSSTDMYGSYAYDYDYDYAADYAMLDTSPAPKGSKRRHDASPDVHEDDNDNNNSKRARTDSVNAADMPASFSGVVGEERGDGEEKGLTEEEIRTAAEIEAAVDEFLASIKLGW